MIRKIPSSNKPLKHSNQKKKKRNSEFRRANRMPMLGAELSGFACESSSYATGRARVLRHRIYSAAERRALPLGSTIISNRMQVVRAGCHTFGSVPSQSKMRKAESRPRACMQESRCTRLQPPLYFCILCFIGKHRGGGFDGFRMIRRSPLRASQKGMAARASPRKRPTSATSTCTWSHGSFVLLIGGHRLIIHLLAPVNLTTTCIRRAHLL